MGGSGEGEALVSGESGDAVFMYGPFRFERERDVQTDASVTAAGMKGNPNRLPSRWNSIQPRGALFSAADKD
jgi:hypothetical protein